MRYLKTSFWPARRISDLCDIDLQYTDWRDRVANVRTHASGRFSVAERLGLERAALRALPPGSFDPAGERSARVPIDGYLKHAGSFYPAELVHQRVSLRFSRDEVWIEARGHEVARYPRSYQAGTWLPAPIARPAPPPPPAPAILPPIRIAPPELSPYAELCR